MLPNSPPIPLSLIAILFWTGSQFSVNLNPVFVISLLSLETPSPSQSIRGRGQNSPHPFLQTSVTRAPHFFTTCPNRFSPRETPPLCPCSSDTTISLCFPYCPRPHPSHPNFTSNAPAQNAPGQDCNAIYLVSSLFPPPTGPLPRRNP